jgi:hypothetical protein
MMRSMELIQAAAANEKVLQHIDRLGKSDRDPAGEQSRIQII